MRNQKIDILRFIGLALIILAHSGVAGILFQARNFDVPLMVLISGLTFQLTFKSEVYSAYVIKRIKRLVFPVWIFLTLYFCFLFSIDPSNSKLSFKTVTDSYLFLGGIGYVWIIRVFLLVALIAPFIYTWSRQESSNVKFLAYVIFVYIGYELFFAYVPDNQNETLDLVLDATVFYLLPYAAVFSIGLRLPMLTRRQILLFIGSMMMIFVAFGYYYYSQSGKLIPTQQYKYPPRAYYLSYAIVLSLFCWLCIDKITKLLGKVKILPLIDFAGRNTIWMYLWHIPLVEAISLPLYYKYPIILITSFLMTYLQVTFLRSVVFSRLKSERLKSNLNLIFTG